MALLAQFSVTAAEIKKGVETLVAAEQSGLAKEIKHGVDTIIDKVRSRPSTSYRLILIRSIPPPLVATVSAD